jgi:hypothetical protein
MCINRGEFIHSKSSQNNSGNSKQANTQKTRKNMADRFAKWRQHSEMCDHPLFTVIGKFYEYARERIFYFREQAGQSKIYQNFDSQSATPRALLIQEELRNWSLATFAHRKNTKMPAEIAEQREALYNNLEHYHVYNANAPQLYKVHALMFRNTL